MNMNINMNINMSMNMNMKVNEYEYEYAPRTKEVGTRCLTQTFYIGFLFTQTHLKVISYPGLNYIHFYQNYHKPKNLMAISTINWTGCNEVHRS